MDSIVKSYSTIYKCKKEPPEWDYFILTKINAFYQFLQHDISYETANFIFTNIAVIKALQDQEESKFLINRRDRIDALAGIYHTLKIYEILSLYLKGNYIFAMSIELNNHLDNSKKFFKFEPELMDIFELVKEQLLIILTKYKPSDELKNFK